ncbi:hypothetical protein, partial [Xanthomonas translucens]
MKMHRGLSKYALSCALLSVLLSSCGGDDPDGSGAAAAADLTMATPSAWSVTTRTPAAAPRAAAAA